MVGKPQHVTIPYLKIKFQVEQLVQELEGGETLEKVDENQPK